MRIRMDNEYHISPVEFLVLSLTKQGLLIGDSNEAVQEAYKLEQAMESQMYQYISGLFEERIGCECLKVRTDMVSCCKRCGKPTDEKWINVIKRLKRIPKK